MSYPTEGRTLFHDCYFCCEVVLSSYWAYCSCCWTGCPMSPDPRAALASIQLTETRAGTAPSISRRKRELCKLPAVAEGSDWAKWQTLHSPVGYFLPCSPFSYGHWLSCRRSGGSGHTCCTLLSLDVVWIVRLSLSGRTGSSKLGAECFPSYFLLSNPKGYTICLGQIVRDNICGSLRRCNVLACLQVAHLMAEEEKGETNTQIYCD